LKYLILSAFDLKTRVICYLPTSSPQRVFSSLLSQEGVQQLCVCVCLSDTKQFPRSRRSGEKSSSHRSLQSISLKVVVQRTGRKRKKDHDAGDKTNKGCFFIAQSSCRDKVIYNIGHGLYLRSREKESTPVSLVASERAMVRRRWLCAFRIICCRDIDNQGCCCYCCWPQTLCCCCCRLSSHRPTDPLTNTQLINCSR
jgi:hypothetical protein